MDAIQLLKGRRSVRTFKDKAVPRELVDEIIDICRYAPSWANFQIARYTAIDNKEVIAQIAQHGVKGFIYNIHTLEEASGVMVLSYVKGKSGMLDDSDIGSSCENKKWETFDAGIATLQFCLAAYAKGIGTCIMGVIDNKEIAHIIDLPLDETVAAIIVYGYPDGEMPKPPKHKEIEQITRFI